MVSPTWNHLRTFASICIVAAATGGGSCASPLAPPSTAIAAAIPESQPAHQRISALRQRFPILAAPAVAGFTHTGDEASPTFPADAAPSAKPAAVHIPMRANGNVRVADPHLSIAFALDGAAAAPLAVADGVALYTHALNGADLLQRPRAEGIEDYVVFDHAPTQEALHYTVHLTNVAGLRLVSNTLEFLDTAGVPRLRVAPPSVMDAAGVEHAALLTVDGCAADHNPRGPWGRPVTPPGASQCTVHVRWQGVTYPAVVDPAWTTTGLLAQRRKSHSGALLSNGTVLIAGGERPTTNTLVLASAELFDPLTGTFSPTGSMNQARTKHTATALANGTALVAGGGFRMDITQNEIPLRSAELYDPVTGVFTNTGQMVTARSEHAAALLQSGKVLMTGGRLTSAEVYDPVAGTFSATGPMSLARDWNTASLLDSGQVLVTGGYVPGTGGVTSAELFDEQTGVFTATGPMNNARFYHSASTLANGQVLVTGGLGAPGSAELYDPLTGTFAPTGPLMAGRNNHPQVVLGSGLVLLAGGLSGSGSTHLSSVELYDPAMGRFTTTAPMASTRYSFSLTLLATGGVVAVAGVDNGNTTLDSSEVFGLLAGEACPAGNGCISRFCVDGYCCQTACDQPCRTCAVNLGTCTLVQSEDDPDTCTNTSTCDVNGLCKSLDGQACNAGSECLNGSCSDNFCCNTACDGACDVCNATPGTCTLADPGDPGTPACPGYVCNGTQAMCPTGCVGDSGCAADFYCNAAGVCAPQRGEGDMCNAAAGADCLASNCRVCVTGACDSGMCPAANSSSSGTGSSSSGSSSGGTASSSGQSSSASSTGPSSSGSESSSAASSGAGCSSVSSSSSSGSMSSGGAGSSSSSTSVSAAGGNGGGGDEDNNSCGCSSAENRAAGPALWLLAAWVLVRRRRSR